MKLLVLQKELPFPIPYLLVLYQRAGAIHKGRFYRERSSQLLFHLFRLPSLRILRLVEGDVFDCLLGRRAHYLTEIEQHLHLAMTLFHLLKVIFIQLLVSHIHILRQLMERYIESGLLLVSDPSTLRSKGQNLYDPLELPQ